MTCIKSFETTDQTILCGFLEFGRGGCAETSVVPEWL